MFLRKLIMVWLSRDMQPSLIEVIAWPQMAHQEEGHRRPNTKPRRRAQATSPDRQKLGSASPEPKDASAALSDPCERSPALPDPEGTGSASPDPQWELRFGRP
jgi:hypothetical protein